MFKIKLLLTSLLVAFACLVLKAEKRKILFIGNSYTSVNDLPTTLKNLALSMGDTLEMDSNTPGGMTFNAHTNDATTLAKIQLGGWDYVVLQAQSQEPSFDPSQVAVDTYPYAKKLDSLVHVSNPCAETIFYMTWGRKNGDASNCAVYPPICTYNGMQQRLRESYLEMAMNNNATCAPAGVAWKKVRDTYPLIELYNADESHPSVGGTYLVACTFYSSLYHRSSVGSTYIPSGLLATDATNLQTIGSNTVLDSLENWQQNGSLPKANYSSSNIQNQFSFTNQSVRSTQYEWNFGDGSAISTAASPIHSFTATGTYTVTLKAKNTCGHYDLMSKSLTVSSVPNGTNDVNVSEPNNVSYAGQYLTINNKGHVNKIRIVNLFGQVIKDASLTDGLNKISFTAVQGVYLYTMLSGNNIVRVGKFTVN